MFVKNLGFVANKKTTGSHFRSTLFNTWSPLFSSCHYHVTSQLVEPQGRYDFIHPQGRPATHPTRARLQGNDMCRQGQLPGNAAAQQHLLQVSQGGVELKDVFRCFS